MEKETFLEKVSGKETGELLSNPDVSTKLRDILALLVLKTRKNPNARAEVNKIIDELDKIIFGLKLTPDVTSKLQKIFDILDSKAKKIPNASDREKNIIDELDKIIAELDKK